MVLVAPTAPATKHSAPAACLLADATQIGHQGNLLLVERTHTPNQSRPMRMPGSFDS